jgi:hypothetical protein
MYVEINRSGQVGKFGPMLWLSSTTVNFTDGTSGVFPPNVGDKVLVTSIGKIADNFIIVGVVADPAAGTYDQPQDPYGEGAVSNP